MYLSGHVTMRNLSIQVFNVYVNMNKDFKYKTKENDKIGNGKTNPK